jgi:hypothetical protein
MGSLHRAANNGRADAASTGASSHFWGLPLERSKAKREEKHGSPLDSLASGETCQNCLFLCVSATCQPCTLNKCQGEGGKLSMARPKSKPKRLVSVLSGSSSGGVCSCPPSLVTAGGHCWTSHRTIPQQQPAVPQDCKASRRRPTRGALFQDQLGYTRCSPFAKRAFC